MKFARFEKKIEGCSLDTFFNCFVSLKRYYKDEVRYIVSIFLKKFDSIMCARSL